MTEPDGSPILVVKDLTIAFRTNFTILNEVSFQVWPGEVVGVLGESGSGKTTLGSAVLGLLPFGLQIVSGSIAFAGRELIGLSEKKWQAIRGGAISMIWQEPRIALNPVMRVGTQVREVIRAHESLNAAQRQQRAIALLGDVRLDGGKVYDAFPHELSGGQCQRVAIAQAIACKPQLVIADEPTSSLDATVQLQILELLLDLRKRLNTAFLLITHNPAIIAKLADRVLVMNKGEIAEQGRVAEILRRPAHPYTKMLLESRNRLMNPIPASS